MSTLYLDVEFTNFQGDLISLALVPEDDAMPALYVVLNREEYEEPSDWVKANVVPHLAISGTPPRKTVISTDISREFAALAIAIYLENFDDDIAIVADWPEDFSQFANLLLTGPGTMVSVPDFNMLYRSLRGFTTADTSKLPHNALYDAIALCEHCRDL